MNSLEPGKEKKIFVWVIDQFGSPSKTLKNENNNIIEQHFHLEFWDIRGLNKSWLEHNKAFEYTDDGLDIYLLNSIAEIQKNINRVTRDYDKVVFLISGKISFWNRSFIKLIEAEKIPYFIRRNRTGFFQGKFAQQTVIRGLTSLRGKLIRYFYSLATNNPFIKAGIKGPSMVFAGTKYDLEHINFPLKNVPVVYTHTKDYDHYLRTRSNEHPERDYIVFIDQYIPFHAETIQLLIDPKACYDAILLFMKRLENITGKKVIFAAHPVSNRTLLEEFVPAQSIVYGKTTELMNGAYCSVSFNSNALLGSFTAGTPIVLARFERLLPDYFNMITNELEMIFNVPSIDIEEPISEARFNKIITDQKSDRDNLFGKYIKQPGTPEKLEFQIICDSINGHLNNGAASLKL